MKIIVFIYIFGKQCDAQQRFMFKIKTWKKNILLYLKKYMF